MWLLQGRYAEESRQELSKLLKYGQTYTLGRKIPADIVVDSKFVSRTSCHITVSSEDSIATQVANISDPLAVHNDVTLRPRVTIRFEANKSRKAFGVLQQPSSSRASSTLEPTEVQVYAGQEHELYDGDSFALTTTISLRLVWMPIAVCFAAKVKETVISPLRKPALQLGIHLSPAKSRWRDGYTHLCLAQVKPTESVLCALLQARPIVTINYFEELFRRAQLPRHDPASLETSFDKLDFTTHQPPFDQQELSDVPDLPQKLLPQERRTYMLKGTTCVLFALPDEETEVRIYRSILSTAGAHVITHDPQAENLRTKADFAQLLMPYKNSAMSYWRNSGSKARSEAPDEGLVVLVGAAHDHTPWKDACTVACTNLRIAMPTGFHAITNAVFSADVRTYLNVIPNMQDGQEEQERGAHTHVEMTARTATQDGTSANVTVVGPAIGDRSSPPDAALQIEATNASPPERAVVQPSAIVPEPSEASGEPSRRPLTRRTRKPVHVTEQVDAGLVQEQRQDDHQHQEGTNFSQARDLTDPTSSSQLTRVERSGLTRRTGASRANARRSDVFDALLQPDGNAAARVNNGSGASNGSSDPTDRVDGVIRSIVPRSRRYRMDLDEQDRAQSQFAVETQASEASPNANLGHDSESTGDKRKSAPHGQAADVDPPGEDGRPASKRPRIARVDVNVDLGADTNQQVSSEPACIVRPDSLSAVGSAVGLANGAQPDSEPQFLQALNTQRAKDLSLDDFDVEFNLLQIAKPGTQSGALDKFNGSRSRGGGQKQQQQQQQQNSNASAVDEDYEAFKKMAEEELRIHVRGNFVQVDFVPLVRQRVVDKQALKGPSADFPNFKKFRPKALKGSPRAVTTPIAHRSQVALVLPDSNDYGLGESYYQDQHGPSGAAVGSLADARGERLSKHPGRQAASRSDDESETIRSSRANNRSRARVALDPASVEETAVDLGLDGLDSMGSEDEADMTKVLERRHGGRSQGTTIARGTKRAATALVQDSDDEMQSASASARQKKRATARGSTILIDDVESDDVDEDEDGDEDDGNFAGFGYSTSTRRRRDLAASGSVRTRRSVF